MSRSYKKTHIWKDSAGDHKRWANKKVRRYKGDLKNGKHYRKVYDQYSICDYKMSGTLQETLNMYYGWHLEFGWKYDELEEIKRWKRFHLWK